MIFFCPGAVAFAAVYAAVSMTRGWFVVGALVVLLGCPADDETPEGSGVATEFGTAGSGMSTTLTTGTASTSGGTTTESTTSGPATSGDTTPQTDDSGTAGEGSSEGGSSDSGPAPGSVLFEEDFEAATDDSVPAGWDSFVGYVVNMNNNPGGPAYALADSSKPHGGSRSLHVLGGQQPAMLTRPLPPGTDRIYVRTYVWLTNKLGQNPDNNHETLIGIRASVGQANDEVRFGEIKGVIGTNEVPTDDISPTMEQWGQGPVIEAGRWHCVEVAFVGDQPNHEVRAWSNGQEVHVVNDPSQWNNGVLGETFLSDKFVEFIIGWHSFSNYGNEIWFDDIVVATERVGC